MNPETEQLIRATRRMFHERIVVLTQAQKKARKLKDKMYCGHRIVEIDHDRWRFNALVRKLKGGKR